MKIKQWFIANKLVPLSMLAASILTVTACAGADESPSSTDGNNTAMISENQAPTAVLTADVTNGNAPLLVNLSGSSSFDEQTPLGQLEFTWDLDADGEFDDAQGKLVEHTFVAGEYTVQLKVVDDQGLAAVESLTISVGAAASSSPLTTTNTASITNTSTDNAALNPDSSGSGSGTATQIADTNMNSQTQVQSASDTQAITQTQTSAISAISANQTDTQQASVVNNELIANISAQQALSGDAPLTLEFDSVNSISSLQIASYNWLLDGQLNSDWNQPTLEYTFNAAGSYEIQLSLTDIAGNSHIASVMVAVTERINAAPIASLQGSGPLEGDEPLSVIMSSALTSDDVDTNSQLSYSWDFGDGSELQTTENPQHTYSQDGEYTISLTVTDSEGAISEVVTTQVVVNHVMLAGDPAVAMAKASKIYGSVPLSINFDGSDSFAAPEGSIVCYHWDFGNAELVEGMSIDYSFERAYHGPVTLIVEDNLGQVSEQELMIQVVPAAAKGVNGAALQTTGNPYQDAMMYVNPGVAEELQQQVIEQFTPEQQMNTQLTAQVAFLQSMPTAIWINSSNNIQNSVYNTSPGGIGLREHFDNASAAQLAAADGDSDNLPPMLLELVIYNIPDRDCNSAMKNKSGELVHRSNGQYYQLAESGSDGLKNYKKDMIDILAPLMAEYGNLRFVVILEPNSYVNMITNTRSDPRQDNLDTRLCGQIKEAKIYEQALHYALDQFSASEHNNVYTYLDLGHAGSYPQTIKLDAIAGEFASLVKGSKKGMQSIRGFASNVGGYSPLKEPYVEHGSASTGSFYVDELGFIDAMQPELVKAGFADDLGFIIDTSRNGWGGSRKGSGKIDQRAHRLHWCNPQQAGLGETPRVSPDLSRPYIDAYSWMKVAGESDGTSDTSKLTQNAFNKRYLPMCGGGNDNITAVANKVVAFDMPAEGQFSKQNTLMLLQNAYPAVGSMPLDSSLPNSRPSAVRDDFEQYEVGSKPDELWTYEGAERISVSDKQVFRGEKSLKIALPASKGKMSSFIKVKNPGNKMKALNKRFYGRAHMLLKQQDDRPDIDANAQVNQGLDLSKHQFSFAQASGSHPQEQTMLYSAGVENDGDITASITGQNTNCQVASSQLDLPTEQWACVEWMFDAPKGEMLFWVDGQLASDLQINKQFQAGCQWNSPDKFNQYMLGLTRPYGDYSRTLFVDDVVYSAGRVGCGITRQ